MRRATVTALAVMLWAPKAPAGPGWAGSFETIREAATSVRTVSAKFTQSKMLKILDKPLISEGSFAFRAPGSIRWEYFRPVRCVLLKDRGKLERFVLRDGKFVPDAAERVEAMRVVIEEIQGWLTGRFEKSKVFKAVLKKGVKEGVKNGDLAKIELQPSDEAMGDFIQRIVLTLDERPGVIRSVRIVESESASTLIEFHDVRLNGEIKPNAFRKPG